MEITMKDAPLISVIIPVYKTEKYLEDCIRSVTEQTYRNLEIILIDDGSPDRCGQMCDDAAQRDSRIVVIHKENGGLSSARNAGLDRCRGEYCAFLDSDDCFEPDMIEYLYDGIVRHQADISVCGFKKVKDDGIELDNAFSTETVLAGRAGLEVLAVDEEIGSHFCNKLFRKSMLGEIRFPYGRVYEDIAIMHEVFARAEKVVCLPECKYMYRIHDGSTSFVMNSRWSYGLFRAFADRYEFIRTQSVAPFVAEKCMAKAAYFAVSGIMGWDKSDETDCKYILDATGFLRENKAAVLTNPNITVKNKIRSASVIFLGSGMIAGKTHRRK